MVFIHRLFQLISSGLINRRQPMRDFGRKGAIELGATNRIGRPVGTRLLWLNGAFSDIALDGSRDSASQARQIGDPGVNRGLVF